MKYEDSFKNNDLEVCFKELGGELTSIKDQEGIEYLWQGDAPVLGGQAPVLFPICGSVRNDTTMYRPQGVGKIPRHGLVRKKNFELVEQTEDRVTFWDRRYGRNVSAISLSFQIRNFLSITW